MRTMIGKRVGPVPIALVAVLALAAFISAGLWLVPNNGAQAQSAVTSPGAMTVDVGEAFSAPVSTWFDGIPATAVAGEFAAYMPDGDDADANPDAFPGGVTITFAATGTPAVMTLSIDGANIDTALDSTDTESTGDLKIIVGYDAPSSGTPPVDPAEIFSNAFTLTVVQNPTEDQGVEFQNPIQTTGTSPVAAVWPLQDDRDTADVDEAACEVVTVGGTGAQTRRSRGLALRVDASDSETAPEDAGTTNEFLVSGGDCTTTGGSVNVMFKSTPQDDGTATVATRYLVYETGGSGYTKVKPVVAKAGLNKHVVDLKDTGATATPSIDYEDQSITVAKSMADDKGVVYLFGYTVADNGSSTGNLASDATTFADDPVVVVKVQFLEAVDAGETDVTAPESIVEDVTTADITVTVNDTNGNPVGGVNVDFDLIGADSTVLFDNNRQRKLGTSMPDGTETVMVKGLPATGAVRVQVMVTIGIGDDAITRMVHLIRKDDPASVGISTYADMPITRSQSTADDESSFFVRAVAYDSAMNDVSDDEGTNLMVVGSDDDSTGAIDTPVMKISGDDIEEWWNTLDCAQMNAAVYPMPGEPAVGSDDPMADPRSPYCYMYDDLDEDDVVPVVDRAAEDWFKVVIGMEADAGTYSVEATAGTGDDKITSADKIEFAVLGGVDMLTLTGPENLGTSQIVTGFALAATAEGGGVPGNIKGEMVTITFSPKDAASVVGSADDMVELDAQGMAEFSVLVTPSRLEGDNLIVVASLPGKTSLPLEVMHRAPVTGPTTPVNRAPTIASGAQAEAMLDEGAMTTLSVDSLFNDPNSGDTVSIVDAYSSNTSVATVTFTATRATITAKYAGTATVTIYGADQHRLRSPAHNVTVTVSSVDLGMPMNLMADAGDGSVTLTWMGGENASMHWIAGVATDEDGNNVNAKNVWMSADGATMNDAGMMMITISMTSDGMALENGTTYKFTVNAGRGTIGEADEEWAGWADIVTATPMAAATGGGLTNPFG